MDAKGKNVTIVDVAERAGVSKTTVSRYLNGKFEFMSEESRSHIAAVIEAMGYRPNNLARGLKSKRTRLLGVVIADMTNPYSSVLLKGISDCCERYGYGVLITNTDGDPAKERAYILSMIDQHVDGIILNTTGKNLDFLLERAQDSVPIVLADRPLEVKLFDTVRSADRPIIYEALRHLKAQGFTHTGLFMEPLENGTRICRCNAYQDACREIFGTLPKVYFVNGQDSAKALLQQFMEEPVDGKRAVLTANGVATLAVVHAIEELGLRFPEDLGLCGFDNLSWTELVSGGITVVEQPAYQVGRECVKRMMIRLYRSPQGAPVHTELACRLILRHSTEQCLRIL